MKNYGMTVFLTTHYMESGGRRQGVVIYVKEKIVADDTPTGLKEKHAMDLLRNYMVHRMN